MVTEPVEPVVLLVAGVLAHGNCNDTEQVEWWSEHARSFDVFPARSVVHCVCNVHSSCLQRVMEFLFALLAVYASRGLCFQGSLGDYG